jgi:hypothetical protein
MQAHVSAHPGFDGPELPTQDGNRYTLPDADGKPVTWNGATTLAKELDNPYALEQWKLRQAVHGMGLRPDLVKLAGAARSDDKATLRQIVKDALGAAATEQGANEGKSWHMAFERVDRGEPIEALPEFFHAGIRNRQAEIDRHGIQILPEYIERAVRCLMFKVSGKLDRIGLYEGQFVIIDDKSEKDPLSYPKAKTIQMAIYAYAGELFDPATFTIEPMPDVRKDIAIMLHFDKTTHECKAYRVPIDIGWWGARLAREVREWRKMDCLIAPLVSLGSWTPKPVTPEGTQALRNTETKESMWASSMNDPWDDEAEPVDPNGDPVKEALRLAKLPISQLHQWCREAGVKIDNKHPARLAEVLVRLAQEATTSDDGHSAVDSVATETLRDDTSSLDSISAEDVAIAGSIIGAIEELGDVSRWSSPTPAQETVPRLPNGEPAVDPIAEAMELSETWLSTHKTKPELQQMCKDVGITDVAHHRAWLAKEYIAARNSQSDVLNSGQEPTHEETEAVCENAMDQEYERIESMTITAAERSQADLYLGASGAAFEQHHNPAKKILDQIEEAQNKQDLQRIYAEITEDNQYPERWPAEATKAGLDRMRVIENMRPVGADSPFA